jgi:hypothetical protein
MAGLVSPRPIGRPPAPCARRPSSGSQEFFFPASVAARLTVFIRRGFGKPPQGGCGTGGGQPPALDECAAIFMDAGIVSLILHYCSLCSALERMPAD